MHTALHPFVWLSAIIQYLSLCLNTALPVYKMLLCSRFVAENNDISRRLQIAALCRALVWYNRSMVGCHLLADVVN